MHAIDFNNLSKKTNDWIPFNIKGGKCDLPNGYYEIAAYNKDGSFYNGSATDGTGLLILDKVIFYTYPDRSPLQSRYDGKGMCRKVGNYRIEIRLDTNA